MKNDGVENQLGALCLALVDAQAQAVVGVSGVNAKASALMTVLGIHHDETIADASSFLDLSHSATVRLVAQMVDRGLILRRPGSDKRAVKLSLTSKGKRLRNAVLEVRRCVLRDALSPLDVEERAVMARLLERMLTHQVKGRTSADQICRMCDEEACPNCPVETAVESIEDELSAE